jgi:hypothetical protein
MVEGTDTGSDREVDGSGDETVETEALDRVIGMLRYADPDEVEVWAVPPPDLEDRIVERVRAERDGRDGELRSTPRGDPAVADLTEQRRRRSSPVPRILAVAAAAVAVVVLAVGAISLAGRDSSPSPDADAVELAGAQPGVSGSVALNEGDEATELHLVASGLDPDTVYAAWLAPPEGQGDKVPAGTVRADENGEIDAELVSSFPLASAARVWVTDPAGETVLRAPLT